ncbi:MAG: NAD-dependent succinate-semialdehyde dehydrogenase [Candidatus Binatia bacterium]
MNTQRPIQSLNPATEEILATFDYSSPAEVEKILAAARDAFGPWRRTFISDRARLMRAAASCLRERQSRLAQIITAEMGKPLREAEAEVAKCAWTCEFFAEHGQYFLGDRFIKSQASQSYIQFTPLGTILAIMPWNYPLWQVIRFAAPALMAGNTAILKPALNVPQCALATEEIFRDSGFPEGVFRTVFVSEPNAMLLIKDPRIAAVTLTGSDGAGSQVAAVAGQMIKKTVLELGGSDPFIVLADADLDTAVETGMRARFQNAGQSCVAAKRFLIVETVYDEFQQRFVAAVEHLRVGDPNDRDTDVGPLARADLREHLEQQVLQSVAQGAQLVVGGKRPQSRGYFFAPTVLNNVGPQAPAFHEEVFGPVASLIKVRDVDEAVALANQSPYGLGASLWTTDLSLARGLAREIEAGQIFINGRVASDPRLPFGGIKRSGYGRELSDYGIQEFTNIQTVWIGPEEGE